MHILKLPEIHILVVGTFMHKFKHSTLPEIFSNFFSENSEHHSHATRGATRLRPPKCKSKIANNFVKKTGVNIWNKLEMNASFNTNLCIATFKKHLKKYIIDIAIEQESN
jgi:hypothetical protein